MNDIDRVHELLDELAGVISEQFPQYTQAVFSVHNDGYRDIAINEWENHSTKQPEKELRRSLFSQYFSTVFGNWSSDNSITVNAYNKKKGLLLGGEQ